MKSWACAAVLTLGLVASCGDEVSSTACAPGDSKACACTDGGSGAQVCKEDGSGYDACVCDGTGAGGVGGGGGGAGAAGTGGEGSGGGPECAPGEERPCYEGPVATEGVGTCHGGTQTCKSTKVWDVCIDQVVPATDLCISAEDEDCDGVASVCGAPWQTLLGDAASGVSGQDIAIGPDDSIVVVGQFSGPMTVGGQTYNGNATGDGFVIKLSPEGAVQWVRLLTGLGVQVPVAVDVGPSGEIAVVGYYLNEANFGLGQTVTAQGPGDGFLWKLDASGAPQWVEIFSGTDTNTLEPLLDVSIDDAGNTAVAGHYNGLIDLAGVELPMATSTLGVVAVLDSTGALQFHRETPVWLTIHLGYEPGGDLIVSTTLGSAKSIDLGQGPITTEAYVASFGPTGAPSWVFPFGATVLGQNKVGSTFSFGVIPLTSGGALFGHASTTGNLDVGGGVLPIAGMFHFSVNGAGAYASSGTLGTYDDLMPYAFAASPDGGALIGGSLGPCPASFTVAGQTYSCAGSGQTEAFLVRMDATGAAVDAKLYGAPPDGANIHGVAVDSTGGVVAIVSWYGSNVDFGAGVLPNGTWNQAVARLGW